MAQEGPAVTPFVGLQTGELLRSGVKVRRRVPSACGRGLLITPSSTVADRGEGRTETLMMVDLVLAL
ncbi:hypothetical protein GCM10025784_26220 [Citricoccus nitrophenolicus]